MAALVETMFSVREKPWHGLGTIIEKAPTSKEALELAGLNWEVEARPIFDSEGKEIQGYKANTRTSDNSILGVVGNRYKIIQNAEAFEFTDALIEDSLTYETAGSLRKGKQIWLLAKMPECKILGDEVEPYICFTNTHDGTGAVRVCMTPIRVVCNNTLNIALSTAKRNWSTMHKGDIKGKLKEAKNTLELAKNYVIKLDEEADRLANEVMTEGEMHDALNSMFEIPKNATERMKKTAEKSKSEIVACMFAPDLIKFLGTKWGFINAVSDYVGHSEPIRATKNWQENRWGNMIGGNALLDKAFSAISK